MNLWMQNIKYIMKKMRKGESAAEECKVTIKNKRGGSSRNTRTTQTKRKRRSALSAGGDAVSSAASTAELL